MLVVGIWAAAGCAEEPLVYTEGHADIAIELSDDGEESRFVFSLFSSGARIGGKERTEAWFPIDRVRVTSSARFTRPVADDDVFSSLCVSPGQPVWWLPQGLRDASSSSAPFLGIAAFIRDGVLTNDVVRLRLDHAKSPSGTGDYTLWQDGFPPRISLATCNGIQESDVLALPIGHDHFNMAFTEPGEWSITYVVEGELAATRREIRSQLTVNYVLEPM